MRYGCAKCGGNIRFASLGSLRLHLETAHAPPFTPPFTPSPAPRPATPTDPPYDADDRLGPILDAFAAQTVQLQLQLELAKAAERRHERSCRDGEQTTASFPVPPVLRHDADGQPWSLNARRHDGSEAQAGDNRLREELDVLQLESERRQRASEEAVSRIDMLRSENVSLRAEVTQLAEVVGRLEEENADKDESIARQERYRMFYLLCFIYILIKVVEKKHHNLEVLQIWRAIPHRQHYTTHQSPLLIQPPVGQRTIT